MPFLKDSLKFLGVFQLSKETAEILGIETEAGMALCSGSLERSLPREVCQEDFFFARKNPKKMFP